MSNLVDHAKRELALLGNGPEIDDHVIKIVEIFAEAGHSGSSAAYTAELIHQLLQFKNLKPITASPDEWFYHGPDVAGNEDGFWQNIRNGEAFSHDGGKSYYLLNEVGHDGNRQPLHDSEPVAA